jgi:hypothetical protein
MRIERGTLRRFEKRVVRMRTTFLKSAAFHETPRFMKRGVSPSETPERKVKRRVSPSETPERKVKPRVSPSETPERKVKRRVSPSETPRFAR